MNKISTVIIMFGTILLLTILTGCLKPQPVYQTEYYQEPLYGMVYYGTLTDSGGFLQSDRTWTFDNAISWSKEYTRQSAREEYKFTITNFDGTENYYYDIDIWDIKEKPGIIRYDQKTRQVCIQNCN